MKFYAYGWVFVISVAPKNDLTGSYDKMIVRGRKQSRCGMMIMGVEQDQVAEKLMSRLEN